MRLKDGDKVIFIEESGRYFVENAALVAINRVQEAFTGEAERLGLQDENDVEEMVKEIRCITRRKHKERLNNRKLY